MVHAVIWMRLAGMVKIQTVRHIRQDRSVPIIGDCTTCTGMYGSGAGIGIIVPVEMPRIQWGRRPAQAACTVAAVGTTTRGSAVLRSGSSAAPAIATATSASASLLSRFNDWKSFSLLLNAEQKAGGVGKSGVLQGIVGKKFCQTLFRQVKECSPGGTVNKNIRLS